MTELNCEVCGGVEFRYLFPAKNGEKQDEDSLIICNFCGEITDQKIGEEQLVEEIS